MKRSSALIKMTLRIPGISEVYHVAYHHAMRAGYQEKISRYLNDFKHGIEPQTSQWISLASPLIGTAKPFDVIVRALRSSEESATRKFALDRLCEAIATESGSVYAPERLVKIRATKTLHGLGGRMARQRELADAYEFKCSGLEENARILVVDDILTTGATLETIAAAILKSLPQSTVIGFVLGKADAAAANAHLDPEYFAASGGGSDPGSTAAVKAGSHRRPEKAAVSAAKTGKYKVAASVPLQPSPKRSSATMYIVWIVLAFVILGALVPLRSGKNAILPEPAMIEPFQVTEATDHPDSQTALPPSMGSLAPTENQNLRLGVVTVPNAGLRANHSLDSKTVPKVAVRGGEKVEILKKFSPNDGPSWMQVRIKSGKVGWVFASVVKEHRAQSH